jgi:hypothetical protein
MQSQELGVQANSNYIRVLSSPKANAFSTLYTQIQSGADLVSRSCFIVLINTS